MNGFRAAARSAAFAAALSLTACGGGGTANVPAAHPVSSGTTTPSGPIAQVSFRIGGGSVASSSTARAPKFISPSTQSASISLAAQGQPTLLATVNVTPGSPNCVTGASGLVCTVTVNAPVGTDTFVITTFDGPNGTGNQLSTGTAVATVALNATNSVALALNGIIASVEVVLGSSSVPAGTAASVAVTVVAYDAATPPNIIIGPGNYSSAVTLINSDKSNVTRLSTTQVLAPGAAVTLSYTGASSAGATITPSVGGHPGTPATFTPTGYGISNYQLPGIANQFGGTLTAGPDGNVWFASTNVIGNITPAGASTVFTGDNGLMPDEFNGLASGSDSAVWYGGFYGNLGSISTSGTVKPVNSVIVATSGCGSAKGGEQEGSIARRHAQGSARSVTCGPVNWMIGSPIGSPSGGKLWFSDANGLIGNIDPVTQITTEWDITTMPSWPAGAPAEPEQIIFGTDGAIYAADLEGLIDRITISSSTVGTVVDAIQLPLTTDCTNDGLPAGTIGLAIDADGTIWTGDGCANLIAVPLANFTVGAVHTWSVATITANNRLACTLSTQGGVWCIDFSSSTVYRISNDAGLNPPNAPVPAISTLAPFSSPLSAAALALGADGNLWAAATDASFNLTAIAKIAYGIPPAAQSLVRSLPAATKRIARNASAIHKRHLSRPR